MEDEVRAAERRQHAKSRVFFYKGFVARIKTVAGYCGI